MLAYQPSVRSYAYMAAVHAGLPTLLPTLLTQAAALAGTSAHSADSVLLLLLLLLPLAEKEMRHRIVQLGQRLVSSASACSQNIQQQLNNVVSAPGPRLLAKAMV
jgi:hypothetical protein